MAFGRLFHPGPITALSIIGSLFLVSIITIFSWIPPNDFKNIANAFIFHFWVLNILKNFFKSAFMGPGHVPFQWKPKLKGDEKLLQFCECCQGFKAPRAHHCKTCKRCVMKMDHHCPWINNCVGHYNHKSFTLFLSFVIVGCSHATIMMILCVWDHLIWKNGDIILRIYEDSLIPMSHWVLICMFFGIGLSFGVTVAVSILLYYQVKSIIKNETGIESWIVEKALLRHREQGDVFVFPYNLGVRENIKQVLIWSADFVGDGITWTVRNGCDQYDLTIEQLEQKDLKRDRTIPYEVIKHYNGRWFPIFYGCRVLYDSPWTDEPRLQIKRGDKFDGTRHRKHWIYGEKILENLTNDYVPALGETRRLKGWVPRCCLAQLYIDEDDDSHDANSGSKKNK